MAALKAAVSLKWLSAQNGFPKLAVPGQPAKEWIVALNGCGSQRVLPVADLGGTHECRKVR